MSAARWGDECSQMGERVYSSSIIREEYISTWGKVWFNGELNSMGGGGGNCVVQYGDEVYLNSWGICSSKGG